VLDDNEVIHPIILEFTQFLGVTGIGPAVMSQMSSITFGPSVAMNGEGGWGMLGRTSPISGEMAM